MYKIKKTNQVLEKSVEVIIPVAQQLSGILGIFPSEPDIYAMTTMVFDKRVSAAQEIVRGIFPSEPDIYAMTTMVFDKRVSAVQEIVRRLCLINTAKRQYFYPTAMTLKVDCKALDVTCVNSYFYDKALAQVCQYLIPKTTSSGILELLNALVMWKQNPAFQRFPALAVALMLYLLQWLVIADQRLCHYQNVLLQTLIYSRPENLIENFYWQLNDIISKINMEEENEDE